MHRESIFNARTKTARHAKNACGIDSITVTKANAALSRKLINARECRGGRAFPWDIKANGNTS